MLPKKMSEEMTISKAVSLLVEHNSKILQFHVFEDELKVKPVFVAFFILGENNEPKEAIDEMTRLRDKWSNDENFPKISIEGEMETSYTVQQIDMEGPYDITRKCKNLDELYRVSKQCGMRTLSDNQRIIKRIDIPLNLSLGEIDESFDRDSGRV